MGLSSWSFVKIIYGNSATLSLDIITHGIVLVALSRDTTGSANASIDRLEDILGMPTSNPSSTQNRGSDTSHNIAPTGPDSLSYTNNQ